jgi:predicted ATPase
MFITRLSLRNFKGFEKADISLSKITLITGANGTGKTSILNGMLAPLQSDAFPFNLAANGKYVNMGDHQEIVFNNDRKRKIGIDITAAGKDNADEQKMSTEWIFDQKWKMPKLCHLKIVSRFEEIDISLDTDNKQYVLDLVYDPSRFKGESAEMAGVVRPLLLFEKMQEEKVSEQKTKSGRRDFDLLKPYNIKGRKYASIEKLFEQIPFMGVLHHITVLLDDVNYISSFNPSTQRAYYYTSTQARKVDSRGENYIEQIYEWERAGDMVMSNLNTTLRELGLAYSLKTKQLNSGQYELRVKVHSNGVWSPLADSGFALNGILPVLVADLQLRDNSTMFLSHPEKYLYPTSQKALGEYLIKQTQIHGKRYVLETNSSSLLNCMKSSITKDECKADDISAYYLERQAGKITVHQIMFQTNGQIENAPESFIEDYKI